MLSFLDNLDRVTASDYYPTDEDMQRCHVSVPSGIKEYTFASCDNQMALKLVALL